MLLSDFECDSKVNIAYLILVTVISNVFRVSIFLFAKFSHIWYIHSNTQIYM